MREALDQSAFVLAAYAIGLGGTLATALWSWLAMKAAEKKRERARDQGRRR
ncbi:hypothetical protein [Qipengyuania sp.]|uniref:hypothetical protein n=1 Tax=Qipengyuania sp. TaxID=2004515 RepID=UPI0035C85DD1